MGVTMHASHPSPEDCTVRAPLPPRRRERGLLAVVLLTALMMLAEIVAGYATHSMALLADGWHMATHVGALGLASVANVLSRRYATHRAFAFGTGKIPALAGYTSAVSLGLVALTMVTESLARLWHPQAIDFAHSLPVAVLGLVVNLISVALLHDDGHDGHGHHGEDEDHAHHDHDDHAHGHDDHAHGHANGHHDHDHNHRAALLHVVADTFTSALAIAALLVGRWLGWLWLDAVSGIVGGLVILKWGVELCRHAAFELLDVDPSPVLEQKIRAALEAAGDVQVTDLHIWSLGRGARSCVVTLSASRPREANEYRQRLASVGLAHLTLEVRRCGDLAASVPG